MLNRDNVDINYKFSNSKCESRFFDRVSLDLDYSSFSWLKSSSTVKTLCNPQKLVDSNSTLNSKEIESLAYLDDDKREFINFLADKKETLETKERSMELNKEKYPTLRPQKFYRPKITSKNIKALMTNEVLSHLPLEVYQHLVSLLPNCDKIFIGQNSTDRSMVLSSTALNNEFFNKALIRFLLKLTNGKSILRSDSFINQIKNVSGRKLSKKTSQINTSCSDDGPPILNSMDIQQSSSSTIRLDYDINDTKVNCNFGVESPIFVANRDSGNERDLQMECGDSSPRFVADNSVQFSFGRCGDSFNTLDNLEFETFQNEFSDIHSSNGSLPRLSSNSDPITVSKNSKYKRRNSTNSLVPTPNTRPTRSTAGQLPARLKSASPQPGTQGTNVSTLLYRSHSPKLSQPILGRKKNREKRKHKSNEHNNQDNCSLPTKPAPFHNDTILLNLRTKLSKRIQENSLKDYSDKYSRSELTVDFQSDNNGFNSKSPLSLSPESDKLQFVDSPLSRNGQSYFRHFKFRNQYFDNQTPTSPQWSFSSEFTSQSSVESVLSQKNMRIDLEDIPMSENLLDDMDSEEMPPPRRTLTVAAMREKMRAKKMAKEEKRKDFDKDFSFDVESKSMELLDKDCQPSTMSNMMSMCQDNEDDSISNEFDSFLIDDYHEEIDDKILNYSDDLDDLLLAGGNESLLEIIMKDPDAMEIGNDAFGTLNSENHHRNPMVSPDHTKCLFSNTHIQSPGNAFTKTSNHNTSDGKIATPLTSLHNTTLSVKSACRIDNSILSQALTSVIQKSDSTKSNSKDCANPTKSALQNAYLVDGNGLSDALKLIQSLHPSAKVTTQQFYLVNSGPQLVLSQAPPNQSCSTAPGTIQTTIKSTPVTDQQLAPVPLPTVSHRSVISSAGQNTNTLILTNTKPSTNFNPSPVQSSTLSVLPQFSAFNATPSNIYSLNSNIGCKFPTSNIQYQSTMSSIASVCSQQSPIFNNQKPITLNQSHQNTFGIRLQLAQNFPNGQQINLIQPSQAQMIPTLMNQSLQFIPPQHNHNNLNNNLNNNLSLITPSQPMSKLVFLYPNLNCPTQISTDLKTDTQQQQQQQQLILLSQPPQDQLSSTPSFQVLNAPNIWQQISPNLNNLLGSSSANNLVLMNPQALNNQPFTFNYHHGSPLITTAGSNLVMMTTSQGPKINNQNKIVPNPISSLSIAVSKPGDESNQGTINTSNGTSKSHNNVNSNSSQNSCIELLSNSSSSANSKISFDDKLSKLDFFTDSDQEKSLSSPQLPLQTSHHSINGAADSSGSGMRLPNNRCSHLVVDIDSPSLSHSQSLYQNLNKATNNNTTNNSINDDLDIEYDQTDFEIPCLYSNKLDTANNKTNGKHRNHGDFDI